MTHYAERAAVRDLKIDDLQVEAVGRFVGLSGYGFEEVEYTVRIESAESPEEIGKLASAAAGNCYVTNTLRRACKVVGHIFLNGNHLGDI
jgi:uncharacterized OsmC-like protein